MVTTQKNLKIVFLWLLISLSCERNPIDIDDNKPDNIHPNQLSITKISVGDANVNGKYRMITFDLKWDNWRTTSASNNWDAVWIFIKYKIANGEWKHATLSASSAEHHSPAGTTITSPEDGKGVFIYCLGTESLNAPDVSLRWNYGLDNVADNAVVSIKVFGIEMVHIPEGSYYAGDNGYSMAAFTKGSNDKRPWFISSENTIEVTNTTTNGYYYTSSKDFWNVSFNANEDISGTTFTIPADFPKGYRAIYCMKYEINQQKYVDFLNTLNSVQALNRYDQVNFNRFGFTIFVNNSIYSTTHPNRACGFISPADGFAYADWAGLRPMTELEFEKICRGSINEPVQGEYAWGTTYCKNGKLVNGTESDREYLTSNEANCCFIEDNFTPRFPLNIGIFAGVGKSRELSGATYYGVMEMSGNLGEVCISLGSSHGRLFTYQNGDGQLATDGSADENNWPQRDGKGAGYRGGNFAQDQHCMQVFCYRTLFYITLIIYF